MSGFAVSEVFQVAVRIEENGERFYRTLGARLGSDTKKLFDFLAKEEVVHKETFARMLTKLEKYEPAASFPEEYFAYLRAYAENRIFTRDRLDQAMAGITNALAAIDYALGMEVDSIVYYQDIKQMVAPNQHAIIDKIIEEERKHFLKLTEMKNRLKE